MTKALFSSLALVLLAGCAGNPKYACGVPDGVGCKPVGEIYQASVTGTLQRGRLDGDGGGEYDKNDSSDRPRANATDAPIIATVQPGDPLLTRPRHIRVWIDRWEDKTGDLHDETYLYLRLDNGTWRLGQ